MFRSLPVLLALNVALLSLQSQDGWEDFRRFTSPVTLQAPGGASIVDKAAAGFQVVKEFPGPAQFASAGYLEVGGTRFYMPESLHDKWLEGAQAQWIVVRGEAVFPPKPPKVSEGQGIDPDTGEDVRFEVYEETVELAEVTQWPTEIAQETGVMLPIKVNRSTANADGTWEAVFAVYRNFDSNIWKYGFVEPSFNMLSDPANQVKRQLISNPSRKEITIKGSSQGERFAAALKPGVVFHGRFSHGLLYFLKAGDSYSIAGNASPLSPPSFKPGEAFAFRFNMATLEGGHQPVEVVPDKISGADYTKYSLLALMGFPFDENSYNTRETMSEWSIELQGDLSIDIIAPLWDGRGAPGMMELESLGLGPSYEEEIALLKNFPEKRPPDTPSGEGWLPIMGTKLGQIPASQRVEETDLDMGDDGL